jgi:hypothetical protein
MFLPAIAAPAILIAAPNLAIERVTLHQFEDGPVLESAYEFLPGETVWLSCRITGQQTEKSGDEEQHVRLSWQMRAVDPEGVLLDMPQAGRIDEVLRREDKNWQPKFLATFQIPTAVPGGEYKIPIRVKDEVAGTEAASELVFRVRGPRIQPAETLVIRNFRFFQSEQDTTPLRPVVYHRGQMLWARFEMAGYKFGENNRFSVSYGLAVLAEDERQLFAQADAAAESKESFYPQRTVPGALSLNVDRGVAPGTYILVVMVEDKVGGQTAEVRETFKVE